MTSLWIEQKYASLMGMQLERFKVTKLTPFNARFRCNVCGDSQTSKFKTRGYLYEYSGRINVKCHNCGYSSSLSKYLQQYNPNLYTEYRIECIKESGDQLPQKFIPDITKFSSRRIDHFEPFKELRKISQLSPNHRAKKYVVNRMIPSHTHYRIYYTDTYMHWVNQIIPDKFSENALKHDGPRIVLPFIDAAGYVFGCTGRALDKDDKVRYSTIIFDETKQKIFGMDSIDRSKSKVYIVEGPIDSLFLDNCVAMAGSDVQLEHVSSKDKLVVVYDNEPRNAEIVKKITKAIDNGFMVCIWPDNIEQKDIDDMVMSGTYNAASVQHIIDQNTFQGLSAKLRMQQWNKV
jgi:transcription elongation factor Elf1